MPKTPIRHVIPGDGVTDTFVVPWSYIEKNYVKVHLNDADISETVTWLSPNIIRVYPVPLQHSTLTITRDTPSDKSLTEFTNGSRLGDDDLRRGLTQSLHVMEETLDDINHASEELVTSSAEAVEAARQARASEVAAASAAGQAVESMRKSESAALRAELAAGGQYPEVELHVVTEIVEEGESLAGSYDPETGTLTFKIPKNMKLEGGGGAGAIELTDRVDLEFSSIGASAKAVKLAYDTAVAARPPLGSTTAPGLLRLATPQEHLAKLGGVAAQPSEVDTMIRAALGETTISTPTQDGLVAQGGDYGEVWTRVNERVYGWTSIWDVLPAKVPFPFWGSEAEIPRGWLICNGQNGTPDLRNRVIIGAGGNFGLNAYAGSFVNTVTTSPTTLTAGDMPPHSHDLPVVTERFETATSPDYGLYATSVTVGEAMGSQTRRLTRVTSYSPSGVTGGASGASSPHSHAVSLDVTQPCLALFYIIKL